MDREDQEGHKCSTDTNPISKHDAEEEKVKENKKKSRAGDDSNLRPSKNKGSGEQQFTVGSTQAIDESTLRYVAENT